MLPYIMGNETKSCICCEQRFRHDLCWNAPWFCNKLRKFFLCLSEPQQLCTSIQLSNFGPSFNNGNILQVSFHICVNFLREVSVMHIKYPRTTAIWFLPFEQPLLTYFAYFACLRGVEAIGYDVRFWFKQSSCRKRWK